MHFIEYYTDKKGRQPVVEWRDQLDIRNDHIIDNKIKKFMENGLKVLNTDMFDVIKGDDSDFYELKGGLNKQCRIAIYHDKRRNTFVLLHGWLKKKGRDEQNIERARTILHRYLSTQGE